MNTISNDQFNVRLVVSRVKSVVSNYCGFDEKHLNMRTSFFKDLGLESNDLVGLSSQVENELKIFLPQDVSRIYNLRQLTKECLSKVKSKK